jgi:hypothetical protein
VSCTTKASTSGSTILDSGALWRVRFAVKGLVVFAISDEEDAKVRPFIAAQRYTYPILLDPGGAIDKRLLVQGIPKSLVYDRTGKLGLQKRPANDENADLSVLSKRRHRASS